MKRKEEKEKRIEKRKKERKKNRKEKKNEEIEKGYNSSGMTTLILFFPILCVF